MNISIMTKRNRSNRQAETSTCSQYSWSSRSPGLTPPRALCCLCAKTPSLDTIQLIYEYFDEYSDGNFYHVPEMVVVAS